MLWTAMADLSAGAVGHVLHHLEVHHGVLELGLHLGQLVDGGQRGLGVTGETRPPVGLQQAVGYESVA